MLKILFVTFWLSLQPANLIWLLQNDYINWSTDDLPTHDHIGVPPRDYGFQSASQSPSVEIDRRLTGDRLQKRGIRDLGSLGFSGHELFYAILNVSRSHQRCSTFGSITIPCVPGSNRCSWADTAEGNPNIFQLQQRNSILIKASKACDTHVCGCIGWRSNSDY